MAYSVSRPLLDTFGGQRNVDKYALCRHIPYTEQICSMSAPRRLNCIEITVATEVLALLHVNIPRMRLVTVTDTCIKQSQVLVMIAAMDDGWTCRKYTTKYCKRHAY